LQNGVGKVTTALLCRQSKPAGSEGYASTGVTDPTTVKDLLKIPEKGGSGLKSVAVKAKGILKNPMSR
jgi:hypothetical protein